MAVSSAADAAASFSTPTKRGRGFVLTLTTALLAATTRSTNGFVAAPRRRRAGRAFAPPDASPAGPSASRAVATSRRMFTGIVEEIGEVVSLSESSETTLWDGSVGAGTELVVKAETALEGAYLGCSICVSGVCLTATELSSDTFKVGLAPETLRRTHLGSLRAGSPVNLERASEIGGRNSGHFVQGHVDGVGTIVKKWTDSDSLFFRVAVPVEIMPYIVEKGFVAIDGTSLTVCDVDYVKNEFEFMLVEYTQKKIVIPMKNAGDLLNIEVDVLGKYAEKSIATLLPKIIELEAKVKNLEERLDIEGTKK